MVHMAKQKFQLDANENQQIDIHGLTKIVKILMYKIGMTGKRQDVQHTEVYDRFNSKIKEQTKQLKNEISGVNEAVNSVHSELEDYLKRQKLFKQDVTREVDKIRDLHNYNPNLQGCLQSLALLSSCQAEFIQMQSTLDEAALNQRIKISEYLNKLKSKTPSNDFNNTVHIADNANEKKSEQTPSNVSVPLAPINQITSSMVCR